MYVRVGQNTIYYKARKFAVNRAVTADIRSPLGTWDQRPAEEVGNGIYQITYDFDHAGKYLMIFSENGTKTFFGTAEWLTLSGSHPVNYIVGD